MRIGVTCLQTHSRDNFRYCTSANTSPQRYKRRYSRLSTVRCHARQRPDREHLNSLREQLQRAIIKEEYEQAASILEEIKQEQGVDVRKLQKELQNAIAAENYEEAARLRDILSEVDDETMERKEVTYTSTAVTRNIRVSATSAYVPQRSSPGRGSYFFVYQITMTNEGTNCVQLKSRCWNITNGDGKKDQVRGPGVVGKFPILGPGRSFSYTSACPISTPTGIMEGSFDFLFLDAQDTELKSVPISVEVAPFLLSTSVIGNINLEQ